ARFDVSLGSDPKSNNSGASPVRVATSFQFPSRTAFCPGVRQYRTRAAGGLFSVNNDRILAPSNSRAELPAGKGTPSRSSTVGNKSNVIVVAEVTVPAFIVPGQRAMAGT